MLMMKIEIGLRGEREREREGWWGQREG